MIKLLHLLKEMSLSKDKWTLIPSSELKKYEEEIFNLISTAYAPIGGHPNYTSPGNVTGSEGDADYEAIDFDDDPEIDAVSISKKKSFGDKFVATGHDGTKPAKSKVVNHKVDLLKKPGYYVEASGKMAEILLAKGITPITDENIVRKVLAGKEIVWHGDGTYDREIGGHMHTKMLLGKPKV